MSFFKVSLNQTKWFFPVEFLACNRYCSSDSAEEVFLNVGIHVVEVQLILNKNHQNYTLLNRLYTYLVFNFLDGCEYILGTVHVLHVYAVESLVQIELHVTHFKVVSSDFQVTGKNSVVDSPSALPFSCPEGIKFDIHAAQFYELVTLIVSLCYTIQNFSISECCFAIALGGLHQRTMQLTCWLVHGLFTDDGGSK